jgi:hypothetical protein
MTMDMIERVAMALHKASMDIRPWANLPDESVGGYVGRDIYRADARVAIEAMREPTEAMVNAGIASLGSDDDRPTGLVFLDFHTAVIDAALTAPPKD